MPRTKIKYNAECLDFEREKDDNGRYYVPPRYIFEEKGNKVPCGWYKAELEIRPKKCDRCESTNLKIEEIRVFDWEDDATIIIDWGVDHYEVLGLNKNASKADIKRKKMELVKLKANLDNIITPQVAYELREKYKKNGKSEQSTDFIFEYEAKIQGLHGKHKLDKRVREATEKLRLWKEACEILFDNDTRRKYDRGCGGVEDMVKCYSHKASNLGEDIRNGKIIYKNDPKVIKKNSLYFCSKLCYDDYFGVENTGDDKKNSNIPCKKCQTKTASRYKRRKNGDYYCGGCWDTIPNCSWCNINKGWYREKGSNRSEKFCSRECLVDWSKHHNSYSNHNQWWNSEQEKLAKEKLEEVIKKARLVDNDLATFQKIKEVFDLLNDFQNSPFGSAKRNAFINDNRALGLLAGLYKRLKTIIDRKDVVIGEVENYWKKKVGSLANRINNKSIEQVLNQGLILSSSWKDNLLTKTTKNEFITERSRLIKLIDNEIIKEQQQQQQPPPYSSSGSSSSYSSGGGHSSSEGGGSSSSNTNSSFNSSPPPPPSSSGSSWSSSNNSNSDSSSTNNSSSSAPNGGSSSSSSPYVGGGYSGGGGGFSSSSDNSSSPKKSSVPPTGKDKNKKEKDDEMTKSKKPTSSPTDEEIKSENSVKNIQEKLKSDQADPEEIKKMINQLKDLSNSNNEQQPVEKDNQETNEEVLIEAISQLITKQPLEKAKVTAEREIKEWLNKSQINSANLDYNWENELKELKTSAQVAKFTQQLLQKIINQDKMKALNYSSNNKSGGNAKLIISLLGISSLLLIFTTIVIFRKKKKIRF